MLRSLPSAIDALDTLYEPDAVFKIKLSQFPGSASMAFFLFSFPCFLLSCRSLLFFSFLFFPFLFRFLVFYFLSFPVCSYIFFVSFFQFTCV